MTEDLRPRREVSISDYCFMIRAGSVLTDGDGYTYLVGAVVSTPRFGRALEEPISDVTRGLVALALALLVGGTFVGAIWFVYFSPALALPPAVTLRPPAVVAALHPPPA